MTDIPIPSGTEQRAAIGAMLDMFTNVFDEAMDHGFTRPESIRIASDWIAASLNAANGGES